MPSFRHGPMMGPVARATIGTTAVFGLRLLCQAGHLVVVARLLGPAQFGTFASVMALGVTFGALATVGTHFSLLESVSRDHRAGPLVLAYALPTTLLAGGFLMIAFLPLALWLIGPGTGFDLGVLAALGAAELLAIPLVTLVSMAWLGRERVVHSQLVRVLPLGLRLIAAGLIWTCAPQQPLYLYAASYLGVSLLSVAVVYALQRSSLPSFSLWRLPRRREAGHAVRFAVVGLAAVGPTEVDKAFAPRFLSSELASVYAASARAASALILPVTAMMVSALPRLFRSAALIEANTTGDRLFHYAAVCAALYACPLAVALWFAAPVIQNVFGPGYTEMTTVLRVFCLAVPGMALRVVASNRLISVNRPGSRVLIEVGGAIFLLAVAIPLTARFQALGMTLAVVLGEWMMAVCGLVLAVHFGRCARSH